MGKNQKKWPSTSLRLQPGGISSGLAQARHSHGTRGTSLTVAAVKPWRGSRACAAWDPAVNTIPWEIGPCASPGGGIPPRCGGLRVQGTASSPCSTTTPNMVCPPPNPVKSDHRPLRRQPVIPHSCPAVIASAAWQSRFRRDRSSDKVSRYLEIPEPDATNRRTSSIVNSNGVPKPLTGLRPMSFNAFR